MGLMSWLRGEPREPEVFEAKSAPIAEFSPALVDAVKWGLVDASWGGTYSRSMSVYTVGQFLAWQIGQVGLKFYRRHSDVEREPLDDLTDFFKEPVEGQTYSELMEGLVWNRILFGNEYWRLVETGSARAIMPLPPFAVRPQGGTLTQAGTYVYELNGNRDEFDSSEIAHFKTFNPTDRRVGISPLEPLRSVIREEVEMTAHRVGYWRNSARMEGIIERPSDRPWSEESFERFRKGWQNAYSGSGNSGKTGLLEDDMTYRPASWSPRDSEFMEGRKFVLQAVATALNVPISSLGLTETATYASEKEKHKELYVDTLGPWFGSIEGVINRRVVPWLTDDPDVYCEFNVAEKMQGDFEQTTEALRSAVGVPYLSVNAALALLNRPPIGDPNDETNPYNFPVQPANVIYGGVTAPGQAPAPDAEADQGPPALRVADERG